MVPQIPCRCISRATGSAKLVIAKENGDPGKDVRFASTLTAVLIIWQGGIGWLTVEMDNLHWSVALHLSSALAFTISMFWLWLTITIAEGGVPDWLDVDHGISKDGGAELLGCR